MSDKMLRNREGDRSVRASWVKWLAVCRYNFSTASGCYEVKGWHNDNEFFDFGFFKSKEVADKYMAALELKMEE